MARKPNIVVCGVPVYGADLTAARKMDVTQERAAEISPGSAKKIIEAVYGMSRRIRRGDALYVCADQHILRRYADGGYEIRRRAPGEFRGAPRRRR